NRSLYHFRFFIEGDNPALMRLDGGYNLRHILIEQLAILYFALCDNIDRHSIILRAHFSPARTQFQLKYCRLATSLFRAKPMPNKITGAICDVKTRAPNELRQARRTPLQR